MKAKIQDVIIEQIDEPKEILRKNMDPEKLIELGDSIRETGLHEPILLRPKNGRYEIVAGHRRFLACKLIRREKISSIVREMSDEEAFIIKGTENEQREDLSPMERARMYQKMKEEMGFTTEKICRVLGAREEKIRRHLALLDMDEEVQEAVDKGVLGTGAVFILNKIDDEGVKRNNLRAAIQNGITEKVAREWLQDFQRIREGRPPEYAGGGGCLLYTSDAADE